MTDFRPETLRPYALLNTKGYSINACSMDPESRVQALCYLTELHHIQPIGHPDHKKPDAWSNLRLDYMNHIWYVPRAWASIHIGKLEFDRRREQFDNQSANPLSLFDLEIHLRDYQVKAFEYVSKYLTTRMPTGIVELPTAWGKSFFAIYLARFLHKRRSAEPTTDNSSHIPYKVLVVVHNTEIGIEWQKTIRMFCKDQEGLIALLDGKHKDHLRYPEAPFLIATVQTLNNLDNATSLGPFELVILDEVHHYGARTFSQVNYVVNGRFMVGLSATPSRKDGLNTVLEAHLGNVFYREEVKIQPSTWTLHVHHLSFTPPIKKMYSVKSKTYEENFLSKITALSNYALRNEYIAKVMLNLFKANPERRLIAFAERVEALYQIEKSLQNLLSEHEFHLRVRVYTGREKKRGVKLEEVLHDSDIILTSYSIFGEGVSSDRLNGIIVVTGLAGSDRMKQPIGRVLRKPHENIDVVVVDFADVILPGLIHNRIRQYKDRMGVSGMKELHWQPSKESNDPVRKEVVKSESANSNNIVTKRLFSSINRTPV